MIKNLSPSLKKRLLVLPIIGVAGVVIGATIAYSQDHVVINSVFELAGYHTIYTETFNSPTNWNTCETIPKSLTVTNDIASSGDIAVRVKLEEQWIAADGVTELPLKSTASNKTMAVINFTPNSGWEKTGSYYYYDADLAKGAASNSLLTGITLNCDANIDASNTAANNADSVYSGASYRLKITAQSIKADLKDSWDGELAEIVAKQENHLGSYTINFSKTAKKSNSVNTANGNGVNRSQEKGKDIFYFRGEIDNNNVVWANKCWKIMRTTYTGGTKMIYNGEPSDVEVDGEMTKQCNATGADTAIEYNGEKTFAYNIENNSPAYVGYMYGDNIARYSTGCTWSGCIYGESVDYDETTGVYTLRNLYTIPSGGWDSAYGSIASRKYSCNSTSATSCTTVKYNIVATSVSWGFLEFSNSKDIKSITQEMFENKNDSNAKTIVESWFRDNGYDGHIAGTYNYENDLEDAIYCNDRSLYQDRIDRGFLVKRRLFKENSSSVNPTLECARNDSFTKEDNVNGNAALGYKIGLPTADEYALAGVIVGESSSTNYLASGSAYITTMSPNMFLNGWAFTILAHDRLSVSNGQEVAVTSPEYLRPVVSLKAGTEVASGSGLKTDPYIIE